MNILNVNMTLDPITGGGSAERTLQISRALNRSGQQCTVLTTDTGLSPAYLHQCSKWGLNGAREDLIAFLNKKGVGTGIHYIPNHLQPFFKPFATSLPVTEQIGEEILTLPLYYDMTDEEVSTVIQSVSDFFK